MEDTKQAPQPIDFDEKYKNKLSVGTYIGKQAKDLVISFGSMFLGFALGNWAGNKFDIPRSERNQEFDAWISDDRRRANLPLKADKWLPRRVHFVTSLVGAFAGVMIGGIIQGYSRWKKHESERLAVSEINEDVANMKIRYRTDPELLRENGRLREMLEQEEQKTEALQKQRPTPAGKIAGQGPRSALDLAEPQTQGVPGL